MRLLANVQTYDLILGKKWCYEHKAILDRCTYEVCFSHKGEVFTMLSTKPKDPRFVSLNGITKDVLKGHALFAVVIRKIPKRQT